MNPARIIAKLLCFIFAGLIIYRFSWMIKVRKKLTDRQKKSLTPAPVILETAFYFFGLYAAFLYGFWYDD